MGHGTHHQQRVCCGDGFRRRRVGRHHGRIGTEGFKLAQRTPRGREASRRGDATGGCGSPETSWHYSARDVIGADARRESQGVVVAATGGQGAIGPWIPVAARVGDIVGLVSLEFLASNTVIYVACMNRLRIDEFTTSFRCHVRRRVS